MGFWKATIFSLFGFFNWALSNWTLKNRAFKGSIKVQYHYELGCATTEVHFGSANGMYALWGKMHENEEVLMGLNGDSIVNLVYMYFFLMFFDPIMRYSKRVHLDTLKLIHIRVK